MSSRFRFFFTAALLAVSLVVIGSSFESPKATAGNGDKVTVCHRTHSVTNPYRRITVARASVVNNNGHQNASHDTYSTTLYPSAKPVPNVFNKSMTYAPATEKKWGDIIPDKDVSGDDLPGTPELNYSNGSGDLRGLDIYNGTGVYAGLCKAVSTADYVKGEKDAGIPIADIKDDLIDQEADEDADALSLCSGNFATCSLAIIESLDTTTTVAPTTVAPTTVAPTTVAPTTVAPTTTVATPVTPAAATTTTVAPGTTGSIKGIIWIDMNRNGLREDNEPFLQNTKVVASKSGSTSASALSNTSGLYEIKNVAPGTWTLTAELTATELERVYDTTGVADWSATASVPAGGTGQADFAAAGKSTISLSLLKTSAKVVAKWAGSDDEFCSADDISFEGTAKSNQLKLTGVPSGSYRVASEDPCDDGVAFVKAAVKKASVAQVSFAPELPATGSRHEKPLTIIALLMLAVGAAFVAPRRRLN